jgi:hypothetical protein
MPISSAFADDADLKAQIDKLTRLVESQAEQLKSLQAQTTSLANQQVKTTEAIKEAPVATSKPESSFSAPGTSLGGYGEIAYNGYTHDSSRNQADLKRFVIFLSHSFNDQLSFNSEVEWEHAVTSQDDQGESEIEQAYLNYQFKSGVNLKTGLFLMPFGFLNQSHEPPVFYGVERNEVETRIIPSTWREGGIGVSGNTDIGIAWDFGIVTGFDTAKLDDASKPLSASHQELQLAKARDLAFYGALNYKGIPGFVFGGALTTGNTMQGNADFKNDPAAPDFSGINGRLTLWDVHTRWQANGWDLQALYAKGTIDDADKIDNVLLAYNKANGTTRAYVPNEFYGWLTQAAYQVWDHDDMTLTPFLRYEEYNTQSKMPTGISSDPVNADKVATVGFSFKPDPQVVFKADYQKFIENSKNDRYNLGIGYMF